MTSDYQLPARAWLIVGLLWIVGLLFTLLLLWLLRPVKAVAEPS